MPGPRARALQTTRAIVEGTPRAEEVVELARERLIEECVLEQLFWQPLVTASMNERSAEHVRRAAQAGRGVLISACHLGAIFLQLTAITSRGYRLYSAAGEWFFQAPSPGYWGRRIARWRNYLRERDNRLVPAAGSFPVLKALLEEGEFVLNYFDMPGSRRTRFLGKPVMLATGTSRLAFQTGALVLPVRSRRCGARVRTTVAEPVDPHEFAGYEELHEALAALHESSILENPAALEDPNRAGAWERGATATGWVQPRLERVA
jgi:lauroyl/myristoyl acyltransferase